MTTSRIRLASLVVGCLLPAACGDIVVGYFAETASPTGTDTTSANPSADPSVGGSPSDDGPTTGTAGDGLFVGCYSDDFEDDTIDTSLWNAWNEQDSRVEVVQGLVKFTPPSTGVFDTGLVSHFDYRFDFEDGWLRMEIDTPPSPDLPIALFLMVQQDVDSLWINIGEGFVSVHGSVDEQTAFSEEFPRDPYPRWLGIRGQGDMVQFEISDDGQAWTTLGTYAKPRAFDQAAAIIMAQTYGNISEQPIVSVERFEACL